MNKQFKKHILTENYFQSNEKVLLAISGGVDSVVLFHLLLTCDIKLHCAHVNYQLRDDASDGDEAFVRKLCEQNNIPIHVLKKDTERFANENKMGIQEAAREIRYQWFDELMNDTGVKKLITAHHADDNIETFFINLIRGTGLKGLTGIDKNKNNIIRPLLFASKNEILDFASMNNIEFRQDKSNFENKYLRNKLRNIVLPEIKNISNYFDITMAKNMDRLKASQRFISHQLVQYSEKYIKIFSREIQLSKEILKDQNASFILYELIKPYGFNGSQCQQILNEIQVGGKVVSESYILTVDRDYFLISPIEEAKCTDEIYNISEDLDTSHLPFSLQIQKFEKKNYRLSRDPSYGLMNFDKLKFPLTIRKWKDGDKFQPLGMKGKKLVSDFLTQEKVTINHRKDQMVLLSDENIVWIVGRRVSELYKLDGGTEWVLSMKVEVGL